MSTKYRMIRSAAAAVGLFALLVFLPGCPFSPDDDPGPPVTGVPERNSVTGAVALYAYAWTNQRYDIYELLLHPDFEYFPQSEDLIDFPWLQGQISWVRTDELQMARNMFDDNFQPADPTAGTVDTIDMQLTIDGQNPDPQGGGTIVDVRAVATVMYKTAGSGARSDVRFQFLVVPDTDEDGLFQIKEQRELPPYQ